MRGGGGSHVFHHVEGLDKVVGGDDETEDAAENHEGVCGGELEGTGGGWRHVGEKATEDAEAENGREEKQTHGSGVKEPTVCSGIQQAPLESIGRHWSLLESMMVQGGYRM